MNTSYRSETDGVQIQLAQQRVRIEQEITSAAALRGLYQRRVARSTAGIIGSLCSVAVFVCAVLFDLTGFAFFGLDHGSPFEYIGLGASTYLLLLAPCLSLLAYLVALGAS